MNSRFLFYRSSFIINITAVLAFILIFLMILAEPGVSSPPPSLSIAFFVGTALYLINDLAGLGLIKRVQQSRDISWAIMNRLIVALFLQFILQLLVAYGLFQVTRFLYTYRYFSTSFFSRTNRLPSFMLMALVIIFFSSAVNIYATIRLMRLARKNQNESREMFESLGSEKDQ